MRLVLNLTDLLEIIGSHLGRRVSPEQVRVVTSDDGGEVEVVIDGAISVTDVRATENLGRTVSNYDEGAYVPAAGGPPVREVTAEDNGQAGGVSMSELLQYSREIEQGISALKGRR